MLKYRRKKRVIKKGSIVRVTYRSNNTVNVIRGKFKKLNNNSKLKKIQITRRVGRTTVYFKLNLNYIVGKYVN